MNSKCTHKIPLIEWFVSNACRPNNNLLLILALSNVISDTYFCGDVYEQVQTVVNRPIEVRGGLPGGPRASNKSKCRVRKANFLGHIFR